MIYQLITILYKVHILQVGAHNICSINWPKHRELVNGRPGDGAPVSKQVTPAWVLSLWIVKGWWKRIMGSPWSTKTCIECKWLSPTGWARTDLELKASERLFVYHCSTVWEFSESTAFNWEFASATETATGVSSDWYFKCRHLGAP